MRDNFQIILHVQQPMLRYIFVVRTMHSYRTSSKFYAIIPPLIIRIKLLENNSQRPNATYAVNFHGYTNTRQLFNQPCCNVIKLFAFRDLFVTSDGDGISIFYAFRVLEKFQYDSAIESLNFLLDTSLPYPLLSNFRVLFALVMSSRASSFLIFSRNSVTCYEVDRRLYRFFHFGTLVTSAGSRGYQLFRPKRKKIRTKNETLLPMTRNPVERNYKRCINIAYLANFYQGPTISE